MNMEVQALVDTESETSIAPLSMFKRAKEQGADIDTFVERFPRTSEVIIRVASGNETEILNSIRLTIKVFGKCVKIPVYVSRALEDVLILGTKVLDRLGFKLTQGQADKNLLENNSRNQEFIPAKMRTYVPVEEKKILSVSCIKGTQAKMFWPISEISEKPTDTETKRRGLQWQQLITLVSVYSTHALVDHATMIMRALHSSTVRNKVFGNVVKDVDQMVASLPITTIYRILARYISIYEQERDMDKGNFLMRDRKYTFVTMTGAQKA
ncbi:hypothetical protein Aduo_008404 [Ancylostoma duodenale]